LGKPFAREFLRPDRRLISIEVNQQSDGLKLIRALRFRTQDERGLIEHHEIGRALGEWQPRHDLNEGAFLAGVSGAGGWYVDSLRFHFSDGTQTPKYGGPGGDSDFHLLLHQRDGRWTAEPRGVWGTISTNNLLETIGLLTMPVE
jgi:hypothetical protein